MDNKTFGRFISELRKEMNYTQKQVAQKIHVTDKAISKWENGKGLPDISNIEALADVYSISIGEIMQCRRYVKDEPREDNAKVIIDNTLDVVHYQKQLQKYKLCIMIFFGLIGFAFMVVGMYFLHNSFMMFDSNGASSYFIVGKVSSLSCWASVIMGIVCVIVGMVQVKRR